MPYDFTTILSTLDSECSFKDSWPDNGGLKPYEIQACFPAPVDTYWFSNAHYRQVMVESASAYGDRVSDVFMALTESEQKQTQASLRGRYSASVQQYSEIQDEGDYELPQLTRNTDAPKITEVNSSNRIGEDVDQINGITRLAFHELMKEGGPPGLNVDKLWDEIEEKEAFGFIPDFIELCNKADELGFYESRKGFYKLIVLYDLSDQGAEALAKKLHENKSRENINAFMEFNGRPPVKD